MGGLESVSEMLAAKFAEAGHEVELITQTPAEAIAASGESVRAGLPERKFQVTRRPSFWKLLRLLLWCDLLFQNNISLRNLIPALLLTRRVIVVHQTWLRSSTGKLSWNNWIKYLLLSFVTNVAISEAIREHAGVPARLIGNPYDDQVFRLHDGVARDRTLVFVGRLVSDKGVDLLLQALKILHADNLKPDLTIIGSGPEEEKLKQFAHNLDLDRQVTFAGQKTGLELAESLNQHKILVVPSRWAEPFGIVALEGIACGCAVVGSSGGGLEEAIGPCGLTFKNGDENGLARCLRTLLLEPDMGVRLRKQAPTHLVKFQADAVAANYLALIKQS